MLLAKSTADISARSKLFLRAVGRFHGQFQRFVHPRLGLVVNDRFFEHRHQLGRLLAVHQGIGCLVHVGRFDVGMGDKIIAPSLVRIGPLGRFQSNHLRFATTGRCRRSGRLLGSIARRRDGAAAAGFLAVGFVAVDFVAAAGAGFLGEIFRSSSPPGLQDCQPEPRRLPRRPQLRK